MCAYNYWCAGTDWATSGRPRVRAGDKIIVHAGTYQYNRYEYTNDATVNRTTPLDGTYYLTADGTAERPIAIVAAGDGEVIFDGNGNYALFDVRAADHTYFEGITFRNSEIAILAGTQFIAGAKGLTVKRSRFEDVGAGVFTNYSGSRGFYIADSHFVGRNDPDHLIGWRGELWAQFEGVDNQIFPPPMRSYVAVKLYGPGHIVAHNYIANFHDGINIETYGNPDGSTPSGPDIPDGPKYPTRDYWDRRPVAIDFYGNYITNSHDNPIEADGGMHNIRIMNNMLINHPSHAFCNQPALGGPVYWIRNIAYHLPGGSTRITAGSAGVVFYNNTILSETSVAGASNAHWRNNLFLGEESQDMIFSVTSLTDSPALTSTAFVRTLPRRLRFHGAHPGLALWRKLPIRITKRSCSLLKQPPWPIIRHLPDRTATVSWWTTTFSLMSLSSAPKISIPSKGSMTQIHWISACVREQVPSTEVCRCPPLQRVSTAVLRTSAHWNTTHRCRTTAPDPCQTAPPGGQSNDR